MRHKVKTTLGLVSLLVSLGGNIAMGGHSEVPYARIDSITGGLRTGAPWYGSWLDPAPFGYVEQEFSVEGDVPAHYTTRIHVIRPASADRFNGTVVVEWANVSAGFDTYPLWASASDNLIRGGFAYVAISAQKDGVDALKAWDPQRYARMSHPGDEIAFDVFSQAALTLIERDPLAEYPDPMGGLSVLRMIATGASQSGGRLREYARTVHATTRIFDGYVPLVVGRDFPYAVAPTLVVTSEYEKNLPPPDGNMLAVWEVAGASHVGYREASHDLAVVSRDLLSVGGTRVSPLAFDANDFEQYGEAGGGPCPKNFLPNAHTYSAAIVRMDQWLRTGVQPSPAPRLEREPGSVTIRRDTHGNALGGVRLPPITVPVATYTGERCDIWGDTVAFDAVTLAELYPDHATYVSKMRVATDAAIADGYLLDADGAAMLVRAEASSIGDAPYIP